MELHKELKRVRKETGDSQGVFAKKLNISREHYCKLENGHSDPTVAILKRVDSITGKQLVITYLNR